jgi:hypothetical protein
MSAQPIVTGICGIQIRCEACGKWTWRIGAWVTTDGKFYHEACVPKEKG